MQKTASVYKALHPFFIKYIIYNIHIYSYIDSIWNDLLWGPPLFKPIALPKPPIGGQQGSPDHEAPRRPIFCTEASAVTSMGPSGREEWGPSVESAKPQNGPAGLGNSLKCFKYSEKLFFFAPKTFPKYSLRGCWEPGRVLKSTLW